MEEIRAQMEANFFGAVDFVYGDNKALCLPLDKAPVQAIRMKIKQVEDDLKANESIAVSTVFN